MALLLTTCRSSLGDEVSTTDATYLEKRQEHEASKMEGIEEKALFIRLPHSGVLDPDGKFHLSWAMDLEREVSIADLESVYEEKKTL